MISVVMATFNGGKYLQEQLKSILEQSLEPDEIIICDDCSTDNTADVIRSMKKMSKIPIHFWNNKEHLGYGQNFRQAINRASGDIIFLCDEDDVWVKNKIELCMDIFNKQKNVLALSTGFYLINETSKPLTIFHWNKNVTLKQISWKKFIKHPKYPGMAMGFRKEIWSDIDNMEWKPEIAHDWMINQMAAARNGMFYLNQKLVFYRQHSNNTIGLIKNESRKRIIIARLKIIDDLIAGLNVIYYNEFDKQHYKQHYIKGMIEFQKQRKQILQTRNVLYLLLYEIGQLKYISLKSICGDIYVSIRGRRRKVCAE